MFTGIIEEVGRIDSVFHDGDSIRLRVRAETVVSDARHGDSIAVNGVCLTVVDHGEKYFTADVMQVTLDYTTLGAVRQGDPVNLERAMAAHGRFGGHIVQGHVDGAAELMERRASENWEVFRFRMCDERLRKYIAPKGSVAVNGTSLTVAEIGPSAEWFEVSLIPTTLQDTMLGSLELGSRVNIECDVLAKYAEALLNHGNDPGASSHDGYGVKED
ncbi:MAG TPA: riboflavin synthase [Candidatus Corynebacterium gallistercoris]|uniref:Riboflavin synthase n=1 Tax=Candidatus Corynebacterium gallistercoris TaxID=2838530 RepID=A0A9D1RYM0_9CORY|nr:riboflavin synthase [Candidatus Corynebacterium gallistercoris]